MASMLSSKFGRRLRIGIISAAVMSYPVVSLLINGPFLSQSFPYLNKMDRDLSKRLDAIILEEYERFLEIEKKSSRNAAATFHRSILSETFDSYVKGTMGIKSGVKIIFPFYVKFNNENEAIEYCKKYLKQLTFYNDNLNVDWNSDVGRAIARTFVLSDKALRFLVLRDLFAHKDYRDYVSHEISWAGYESIAGFTTYSLHSFSKYRNNLGAFFILLTVTSVFAYFGSKHWFQVYRHIADLRADESSAIASSDHSEGGEEYYRKMLTRNRMLAKLAPDGFSKSIKITGDVKNICTPYLKRYLAMKNFAVKDEKSLETKEVFSLDD